MDTNAYMHIVWQYHFIPGKHQRDQNKTSERATNTQICIVSRPLLPTRRHTNSAAQQINYWFLSTLAPLTNCTNQCSKKINRVCVHLRALKLLILIQRNYDNLIGNKSKVRFKLRKYRETKRYCVRLGPVTNDKNNMRVKCGYRMMNKCPGFESRRLYNLLWI